MRPSQGPAQPTVGWRGSSRPATIGGGPGRHCRQLDSDTGDALAHLATDRHAAQAPVMQRKPGEGSTPETRAPCRQSSVARNPRTAAAWAPLPRGRTLPLAGVRLDSDCSVPHLAVSRLAPHASATRAWPYSAHQWDWANQGQDVPHTTSPWARLRATLRASAARADSDTDPVRGRQPTFGPGDYS